MIIDDEEDILFSLKFVLKQHFRSIHTESNPNEIPRLVRQLSPDVILLDMNFAAGRDDGREGILWLNRIKEMAPSIPVIMMTAYSDVGIAVDTLKAGATDFIEKPWRNEKLVATLHSAMGLSRTQQAYDQLKESQQVLAHAIDQPFNEMIGNTPAMQEVFRTVDKVASTDADVLIIGANGTGKELVARALHRKSARRSGVFIPVDLGAIPDHQFESELFGHVKGAQQDVQHDRIGRVVAAQKGTLFLDEVGHLSLPAQAKLLQVLQRNQVFPLGGDQPLDVDVRLVCAANTPLYELVEKGQFRQDLLYRINTVEIRLPLLRDRTDDIPLLAEYFLRVFSRKYNKPNLKLHHQAIIRLKEYHWPGNVRELRHIIERAAIMTEGQLVEESMLTIRPRNERIEKIPDDNFNLEEMERKLIEAALSKHHGNISKAASELGLTRASLYRRLEKHNL